MTRHLIPAAILLVGAGLLYTSSTRQSNERDTRAETAVGSVDPLADFSKPSRTKSKIRNHQPKPTVEQTEELLRSTIIPLAELPEQSLSDTVAAINRLIAEAGVQPHALRLACAPSRIRVRNVPVAAVLQIVIDHRAVRYRVREGTVEFIPPYLGDFD